MQGIRSDYMLSDHLDKKFLAEQETVRILRKRPSMTTIRASQVHAIDWVVGPVKLKPHANTRELRLERESRGPRAIYHWPAASTFTWEPCVCAGIVRGQ